MPVRIFQKAEARERWLQLLPSVSPKDSENVCLQILSRPEFQRARQVGLYGPRLSEVNLSTLWEKRPESCVFPRVDKKKRSLTFFSIRSWDELVPGFSGIWEPGPKAIEAPPWTAGDLVLVPGMAFDCDGARVGTGAGYYDRFLASVPSTPWGICWENQIVPGRLAQEPTDVRMKAICTERQLLVWDSP